MSGKKVLGYPHAPQSHISSRPDEMLRKMPEETLKIIAIGDSITYGYPYTPRDSWVHLASQRMGIPIINKGEPGEITAEMRSRFFHDVVALEATHVIILGGTNDAFYNVPQSSLRNNIYKMVEAAVEAEIIPIIGIPIPVNDRLSEERLGYYRNWMQQYAVEQGYQIIDFYNKMVESRSGFIKAEYHDDGIHPNRKGYQAMSEVVYIK